MNYPIRLLFLVAALGLVSAIPWVYEPLHSFKHKAVFVLLPLFGLLTLFQHYYLMKRNAGSPSAFVRSFMGMVVMKMLVLVGAFIIALLLGVMEQAVFTGWFVLMYISFTAFEVVQLSRELNRSR